MREGEGSCGAPAKEYSCTHGAQINFGDLTPYLTYVCKIERSGMEGGGREAGRVSACVSRLGSFSIVSARISQRRERQKKKVHVRRDGRGTEYFCLYWLQTA
jgi:hypothetical protein